MIIAQLSDIHLGAEADALDLLHAPCHPRESGDLRYLKSVAAN